MENPISTLENGWRAITTGEPPEGWTPVDSRSFPIGGVPAPPNLGYYPDPTSRCPVPTPDLSASDNLREFYRNGGAFRRFWPKQSKS